MPWFKGIISVWKPIGNGAVDQKQFWNNLHHNSYSASSVGFYFSHTDVSEWLEHLLGLKSHRALQSPQHLGHKQRLQFLYYLHTDSSSNPQMLQGNGCQANRICTVVCQFSEGCCHGRYELLLLKASKFTLIVLILKPKLPKCLGQFIWESSLCSASDFCADFFIVCSSVPCLLSCGTFTQLVSHCNIL